MRNGRALAKFEALVHGAPPKSQVNNVEHLQLRARKPLWKSTPKFRMTSFSFDISTTTDVTVNSESKMRGLGGKHIVMHRVMTQGCPQVQGIPHS